MMRPVLLEIIMVILPIPVLPESFMEKYMHQVLFSVRIRQSPIATQTLLLKAMVMDMASATI